MLNLGQIRESYPSGAAMRLYQSHSNFAWHRGLISFANMLSRGTPTEFLRIQSTYIVPNRIALLSHICLNPVTLFNYMCYEIKTSQNDIYLARIIRL